MISLVIGGAASGKSEYAESLAVESECEKKIYIATMLESDEECRIRILKHQSMRAQKGFNTLECPIHLNKAVLPQGSCVLLECLSNLLANEMYTPNGSHEQAETEIKNGLVNIFKQAKDVLIVSNQIFSDGIKYDLSTQRYLNYLGNLHNFIAEISDNIIEVVCGIPVYHISKK